MPAPLATPVAPHAAESDEQLAQRVAKYDDNDAFNELVIRRGKGLIAYCAARLTDKSAAKDFAQEAWLRVWKNRAMFDDDKPDSYRKWLYTQAFRKSMDDNRKNRRRPEAIADPIKVVTETSVLRAMHRERGEVLDGCVEKLSPLQQCVVRATLEGHKTGAAAVICRCTPEQASSAKHAAIPKLAECTERKGV